MPRNRARPRHWVALKVSRPFGQLDGHGGGEKKNQVVEKENGAGDTPVRVQNLKSLQWDGGVRVGQWVMLKIGGRRRGKATPALLSPGIPALFVLLCDR